MVATTTVLRSSPAECRGCEYSRARRRPSQRRNRCIDKFCRFCKYIFCCGCCKKKRKRRPSKSTRRGRSIECAKRGKESRNRKDERLTSNKNGNELQTYYSSVKPNSTLIKPTHDVQGTSSKPYFKQRCNINKNKQIIGQRSAKHGKDGANILKQKLLKLKESGRVRHVGVSNMNEEQLSRLCAVEKPACLQVEVHVLCQQKQLIAAANRLGIPIVAYSPLGSKELADALAAKTGRDYPNLLELPTVLKIAKAHSRTPAQVLLRYLLQHGVACIPKSTSPSRIKENISLWDFELTKNEMQELAALDRGENGRICDFAFFVGAEKHPEFPFKK
ncbi:aldo-keto reductase family 1 member C15-like isoform X1 [Maniola jurtina]|uniref:aldo-keto reductase family 1 member C15-like isoform X1 n=1 Tax=Maniola jurtina TaxID=191418 RepID=UPI001E68839D|nr:aldo-keto reductase family 1 member C15-like isoform X1 [Maniola jurtina]